MIPIRVRFFLAPFALITLLSLSSGETPKPTPPTSTDALLALYRDDHLRPLVVEYYTTLTSNRSVAVAILKAADELEIDPSLAFAMAWQESRFNPRAFNRNVSTYDRGLFQLNSRTFTLDRTTVYDPHSNARLGLTYFKKALDKLGSEEKALGYYNSGIGLKTNRALPRSTQAYIKKILADRDRMDRDAIAWIYFSHETTLALR